MLLKIAVFVITGIVFLVLIKKNAPNFAVLCELTVVAVIIIAIIPETKSLLQLFERFQDFSSVSASALKILFKTFGVLVVGSVVSDICRDNGESAVAGVVELSVKLLGITFALPVFTAVIEIALSLLSG